MIVNQPPCLCFRCPDVTAAGKVPCRKWACIVYYVEMARNFQFISHFKVRHSDRDAKSDFPSNLVAEA